MPLDKTLLNIWKDMKAWKRIPIDLMFMEFFFIITQSQKETTPNLNLENLEKRSIQ